MPDVTRPTDYGVLERDTAGDDIAAHVERIRLVGYSVLPGLLSADAVDDLRRRLDDVVARQTAAFGADRMAAIGDERTARCPLVDDEAFLAPATHPGVLAICRRLLGDYVVLMQQNGVINPPDRDHRQGAYHRDLPYQHFVSSRPLAVSALWCLDPFRHETGATLVVPASHRAESFPSDAVAAALETPVEADAGACLVFDSMLFHRAGVNRSSGPRRALNHVYTIPLIAQQISLPAALDGRYRDDPALARLLGYDAAPPDSALAWRMRRLS